MRNDEKVAGSDGNGGGGSRVVVVGNMMVRIVPWPQER